jgi:hypothetical protein
MQTSRPDSIHREEEYSIHQLPQHAVNPTSWDGYGIWFRCSLAPSGQDKENVRRRPLASLPRRTQWRERNGTMTRGIVVREVSAKESFPWGDYHKVIQLMELRMVGGERVTRPHHVVRFGYYVKDHRAPAKRYRWGKPDYANRQQDKLPKAHSESERR